MTEAAVNAAADAVAPGHGVLRDLVIPIVIAALLLGAVIAVFIATTAFASDPMTGT